VSIDFLYEEGAHGRFKPVVRDVGIRDLTVQRCRYALYLRGLQDAPIEKVQLTDCDFHSAARANVIENAAGLEVRNVRVDGRVLNVPHLV
jgi:hypothetical protein